MNLFHKFFSTDFKSSKAIFFKSRFEDIDIICNKFRYLEKFSHLRTILFWSPVVDLIMSGKYYLGTVKSLKYPNDLFSLSVLGLCYSRICKCMWPLEGEIYIFNICWIPYLLLLLFISKLFLSLTQLTQER